MRVHVGRVVVVVEDRAEDRLVRAEGDARDPRTLQAMDGRDHGVALDVVEVYVTVVVAEREDTAVGAEGDAVQALVVRVGVREGLDDRGRRALSVPQVGRAVAVRGGEVAGLGAVSHLVDAVAVRISERRSDLLEGRGVDPVDLIGVVGRVRERAAVRAERDPHADAGVARGGQGLDVRAG